jgi:hypothetical protein
MEGYDMDALDSLHTDAEEERMMTDAQEMVGSDMGEMGDEDDEMMGSDNVHYGGGGSEDEDEE